MNTPPKIIAAAASAVLAVGAVKGAHEIKHSGDAPIKAGDPITWVTGTMGTAVEAVGLVEGPSPKAHELSRHAAGKAVQSEAVRAIDADKVALKISGLGEQLDQRIHFEAKNDTGPESPSGYDAASDTSKSKMVYRSAPSESGDITTYTLDTSTLFGEAGDTNTISVDVTTGKAGEKSPKLLYSLEMNHDSIYTAWDVTVRRRDANGRVHELNVNPNFFESGSPVTSAQFDKVQLQALRVIDSAVNRQPLDEVPTSGVDGKLVSVPTTALAAHKVMTHQERIEKDNDTVEAKSESLVRRLGKRIMNEFNKHKSPDSFPFYDKVTHDSAESVIYTAPSKLGGTGNYLLTVSGKGNGEGDITHDIDNVTIGTSINKGDKRTQIYGFVMDYNPEAETWQTTVQRRSANGQTRELNADPAYPDDSPYYAHLTPAEFEKLEAQALDVLDDALAGKPIDTVPDAGVKGSRPSHINNG